MAWVSIGLMCVVIAAVGRWRWVGEAALALAILLAGVGAGQVAGHRYPAAHISQYSADEPQLAQLELRIDQPPRVLSEAHAPIPLPPRQVTQGTVLRILTRDGWHEATGRVLVHVGEVNAALAVGQRVRMLGTLSRPMPAANPGQFDAARYYRDQGILCSLHVPHAGNVTILESPGPTILQRIRQAARRALEMGFTPEHSLDHALLRALVLGDGDPQLRDVQEQFMRSGLSHHLAISGMHIVIVGALAYGVCKALFLPPRLSAWLGLGIVLLYGLVVLPSPPVVRSVLLCVAFVIGLIGRKSLDGVQLLALSVLAMLMYHPLDLYSAGFQLSFGTVLGLMVISTPVLKAIEATRDIDFVIAEQAMGLTRRQQFWKGLRMRSMQVVVTGLVAWLVSAPIVEYHFNQLNPWQVLSSIALAVPVFLALVFGVAKIVLTLAWPSLAGWWAALAAWPVEWMRRSVEWLALLPGSDVAMPSLPLWLLAIYFVLLAAPMWPGAKQTWRRFAGAGCMCIAVLMMPMAFGSRLAAPAELRITLLSVGAGQCAVLRTPGGKTVLIDAGSLTVPDVARTTLTPYLKHAGIGRIDAAFISHANQDHFAGVIDAARRFGGGAIHISPQFPGHMRADPRGDEWLDDAGTMMTLMTLSRGMKLALDDQTSVEVLWPDASLKIDPNNASLVLRVTCAGRSVLFTGDILDEAQRQLATMDVKADILIAPHHGSSEASSKRFLEAVNPSIILASNGRKLSQKQRHFDDLAAGRQLYRTHAHGAVSVIIDGGGGMRVKTFRKGS